MRRLNRLAFSRNPVTLIVAVGAIWASVLVAQGATAMSPIAGWLWLTVLFITRRTKVRERSTRAR